MNVKRLIYDIIEVEGGYVNNKLDSGGPTKYGITLKTLSTWYGRRATIDEVKKLTTEEAYKIYLNKYYVDTKVVKLPIEVQHIILDITINSWIKVATVILQQAINSINNDQAIEVDGKLGDKTIEATKKLIPTKTKELINRIVDLRLEFYRSIVENNPSQRIFLAGWENRANAFRV